MGRHFPKHSQSLKGKYVQNRNPNWKGGKTYKSGYVLISSHEHPFKNSTGYVYEHRLIVEKHLGRYLKPEEAVHHINGDKSDNRIENLYLFPSNSSHIAYHMCLKYNPSLIKKITKSNLL